jgi:hypothetical protein
LSVLFRDGGAAARRRTETGMAATALTRPRRPQPGRVKPQMDADVRTDGIQTGCYPQITQMTQILPTRTPEPWNPKTYGPQMDADARRFRRCPNQVSGCPCQKVRLDNRTPSAMTSPDVEDRAVRRTFALAETRCVARRTWYVACTEGRRMTGCQNASSGLSSPVEHDINKEVSMTLSRLVPLVLLTAMVACEDPYLTNPNLRLLLKVDGHYLFSPVLSADRTKLYYLDDTSYDHQEDPSTVLRGDLWVHDLDDSTSRMLLQGTFCALALSADGHVLAALSKPERAGFVSDSTLYLLLDTGTTTPESIYFHHSGSQWAPWGVHFSSAGDKLFLDGWNWHDYAIDSTLVYRMDLLSDSVTRVASYPRLCMSVVLLGVDSVYAESTTALRASVNPRDSRWLVFPKEDVWTLRDMTADTLGWLGAKSRPYYAGYIDWPTWTADGRDLVFSAMAADSAGNTRLEVWMLEDALKDTARVQ